MPALSNYIFKRDNFALGNYIVIQTLSASSTFYTDAQYTTYQATADWRIETLWSISCTPTMRHGNNGTQATIIRSKSNITNNRVVSVNPQSAITNFISVYPNPGNDLLNVECRIKNADLIISDVLGNTVKQINASTEKTTIDISNLQNGVYFISLKDAAQKTVGTQKIIIQP